MKHQRFRRLSQLMVIVTAMAIAIGIYMVGTSNSTPGNDPAVSVQTETATGITSAAEGDEAVFAPGAQQTTSGNDTTLNTSDRHESNRFEPEESGNDD